MGIYPRYWELMHVTLYAEAVPESAPGARYEVLHLSAPELDLLSLAART